MRYKIVTLKWFRKQPGCENKFMDRDNGYILIRKEKHSNYKQYNWFPTKELVKAIEKSLKTKEGIVEDINGVKYRVVNFDYKTMEMPKGVIFYHLWQRKAFESQGWSVSSGSGPSVSVLCDKDPNMEPCCYKFGFPNEYIRLVKEIIKG